MLVILAHAAVSSDPREGAFDDPGETHNLECPLTAFDDAKLVTLGFDEPCELSTPSAKVEIHAATDATDSRSEANRK